MELTRYHVTDRPWDGNDLLCRSEQDDPAPWKWDEAPEGFDSDVVCLFPTEDEAREFMHDFDVNGGSLLRITLTQITDNAVWDGHAERRLVTVREGYDAVVSAISADAITEVTR